MKASRPSIRELHSSHALAGSAEPNAEHRSAQSSVQSGVRIARVIPLALLCLVLPCLASALDAGDRAPDFAAPSLKGGETVELSDYRGKVVYLDFWASWCGPCLKAIPEVEEMRAEFPASEFQIIAVNLDKKKKKALRFLEKNPIGYPSASDPKGTLPGQFGLETMPTSYLIDENGVIRYVHRGFKKGDGSKLREEIRNLLGIN